MQKQMFPQAAPVSKPLLHFYLTAINKGDSAQAPTLSGLNASIDKQPVEVTSVRSAKGDKLLFAILVDASTSSRKNAGPIKSAAMQLFQGLSAGGNQGYLVPFDVDADMNKTPVQLSEARTEIDRIQFGGGTALFDTIGKTCTQLLSRAKNPNLPRRAIILLSDGEDNQSRLNSHKAMEIAEREGVTIFSLTASSDGESGEQFLKEAGRNTGGQVSKAKKLEEGVTPLLLAIDSQWVLDLAPAIVSDQKLHSLSVATTNKDIQISAPTKILIP
jgi:Mg-chelatase subunit ChlD